MALRLTNPGLGLESFQQGIITGDLILDSGKLDPDLYVLVDDAGLGARFTFARIREDAVVTAIAIVVVAGPMEGLPCFQIGYAVPKRYRNRGRAKEVVKAALAEFQHGFANAIPEFFVGAVVGADNPPSQAVAAATISDNPKAVIDQLAGVPVLQYIRKFENVAEPSAG